DASGDDAAVPSSALVEGVRRYTANEICIGKRATGGEPCGEDTVSALNPSTYTVAQNARSGCRRATRRNSAETDQVGSKTDLRICGVISSFRSRDLAYTARRGSFI